MQYLLIIFTSFILINSISHAAKLDLGDGLTLMALDGDVLQGKVNLPIDLKQGNRQVVIRYGKKLPENSGISSKSYRTRNHKYVSSRPYIFTIDMQQDTKISVQKFSRVFEAENAIRRGLVFIVETSQERILIENSDQLYGNGSLPFNFVNLTLLIEKYNQTHDVDKE